MSTAFFLSALLHTAVVVALLAIAFTVQQRKPPPVVIFDLVAGPGNDLTATKAPARGTPEGGVDVKIPAPPAPRARPAEPEPVAQERTPTRTETKSAAAEKAENRDAARLTYEQYVKKYGKPAAAHGAPAGTPRPITAPRIKTRGIPDGVVGGSPDSQRGSGGNAMVVAEHSALEGYISRLVSVLRQNHEKPPGLSDLLSADVEFFIAADGTISRVRISHSSGNAAFDASCIETFRRIGSIGPKPDGKSDTWVLTFRMKDEE
jgi:colicin import membrane protein